MQDVRSYHHGGPTVPRLCDAFRSDKQRSFAGLTYLSLAWDLTTNHPSLTDPSVCSGTYSKP